ncbi:hypothetical protein ACHAWT_000454 [Skeletonema menzelii]
MNSNSIIAILATSLLCITAVPSVHSFGGYVVSSNIKNARVHHVKCWRTKRDIMCQRRRFVLTDGVPLRHSHINQLQVTTDDSSNGSVDDTERRVSKRKRLLNLVRRIFHRRTTKQQEVELEEEEFISVTVSEDVSISEVATASTTEDAAMEDELDIVDDDTFSSSINTTTPTRQATASPNTDLSGTWSPIVSSTFKSEYDDYLKNCSQSFMFRKVVVNGIEFQRETIRQLDNGQSLQIIAQNPAGNWNRTLIASDSNNPLNATIVDPDKDTVNVEAWWEENGTKHKSVLRGKPRLKGGVFETVRYLDEKEKDVLICESTFLPSELDGSSSSFKYASVLWRFQRVG